ncbi:hypothetical protein [Nocardia mangyaensis]|uniref:hypothetical protein n=1 Tax=Nocardia mangyaensis TaxID=2213200 RepID=UPI0012EBA384|nr:hypothetical protein [Nocardia mangyaensis]
MLSTISGRPITFDPAVLECPIPESTDVSMNPTPLADGSSDDNLFTVDCGPDGLLVTQDRSTLNPE